RAIREAEWVVLGPGSWYTSVIPHLLVPELARALAETPARRALTLNLSTQPGETEGMSAGDHLRTLLEHSPDLRLDVVIADPVAGGDIDGLLDACGALGAGVVLRKVRAGAGCPRHDRRRLAAAYRDAFDDGRGDVGRFNGEGGRTEGGA